MWTAVSLTEQLSLLSRQQLWQLQPLGAQQQWPPWPQSASVSQARQRGQARAGARAGAQWAADTGLIKWAVSWHGPGLITGSDNTVSLSGASYVSHAAIGWILCDQPDGVRCAGSDKVSVTLLSAVSLLRDELAVGVIRGDTFLCPVLMIILTLSLPRYLQACQTKSHRCACLKCFHAAHRCNPTERRELNNFDPDPYKAILRLDLSKMGSPFPQWRP